MKYALGVAERKTAKRNTRAILNIDSMQGRVYGRN